MSRRYFDTIAAICTPAGSGAVGIIRISGENTFQVTNKIFKSECGIEFRKLIRGALLNPQNNEMVDPEVFAVYFKEPDSFTGEDVVELYCHGGIYILQNVLEAVIDSGARLAEPGEFTKRRFLSGKMNLLEAEAINDMIQAKTSKELKLAMSHFTGGLTVSLGAIKEDLLNSLAEIEAYIDFSMDEIERLPYVNIQEILIRAAENVSRILNSYKLGRMIRHGARTLIAGRPNSGKSSLLNSIIGRERAIVTKKPGTTRDYLEELIDLNGFPVRLIDSAGIRKTEDEVEAAGVIETRKLIKNSDIILFILDSSEKLAPEDFEIQAEVKGKRVVYLLNKTDLPEKVNDEEIRELFGAEKVLRISALTGDGIGELKDTLLSILNVDTVNEDEIITNLRHKKLLEKCKISIKNSLDLIESSALPEVIYLELNEAVLHINEILGEGILDDILDKVFSRFCIGK